MKSAVAWLISIQRLISLTQTPAQRFWLTKWALVPSMSLLAVRVGRLLERHQLKYEFLWFRRSKISSCNVRRVAGTTRPYNLCLQSSQKQEDARLALNFVATTKLWVYTKRNATAALRSKERSTSFFMSPCPTGGRATRATTDARTEERHTCLSHLFTSLITLTKSIVTRSLQDLECKRKTWELSTATSLTLSFLPTCQQMCLSWDSSNWKWAWTLWTRKKSLKMQAIIASCLQLLSTIRLWWQASRGRPSSRKSQKVNRKSTLTKYSILKRCSTISRSTGSASTKVTRKLLMRLPSA